MSVDVVVDLGRIFSAFDTARQFHASGHTGTQACTEAPCDSRGLTADTVTVELRDESTLRHRYSRSVEMMRQSCGFAVERRPSTLKHAGTGVLVTGGTVPAGVVTSLYPGTTLHL